MPLQRHVLLLLRVITQNADWSSLLCHCVNLVPFKCPWESLRTKDPFLPWTVRQAFYKVKHIFTPAYLSVFQPLSWLFSCLPGVFKGVSLTFLLPHSVLSLHKPFLNEAPLLAPLLGHWGKFPHHPTLVPSVSASPRCRHNWHFVVPEYPYSGITA